MNIINDSVAYNYIEATELPKFIPGSCEHPFSCIAVKNGYAYLRPIGEVKETPIPAFNWSGNTDNGSVSSAMTNGINLTPGNDYLLNFNVNTNHTLNLADIEILQALPFARYGLIRINRKILGSWRFKFLGSGNLNRLYNKYGEQSLTMIEKYPSTIQDLLNLDNNKMLRLVGEVEAVRLQWHEIRSLLKHGLNIADADLVVDMLGNTKENSSLPDLFALMRTRTMNKTLTDQYFKAMGIDQLLNSNFNQMFTDYLDLRLSRTGDTAMRFEDAVRWSMDGLTITRQKAVNTLESLIKSNRADERMMWGERTVSLGKMLQTDRDVADGFAQRQEDHDNGIFVDKYDTEYTADGRTIDLVSEQRMAIEIGLNCRTCIITGGPGVGKTTLVKTLLKEVRKRNTLGRIFMACPTGKSARRMTEVTGEKCMTLHKLMGMTPDSSPVMTGFRKTDTLILDEASMMDINLLASAVRHTKDRGRLILLGDPDQIASIENGAILMDAILARHVTVAVLSEVQRQAALSKITMGAYSIREGVVPEFDNDSDFVFIEGDSPDDIADKTQYLIETLIPDRYNIAPENIQILSAMRKGVAGVNNLNERLKPIFNPQSRQRQTPNVSLGNQVYHLGDRIMQLKNRYDLDVQNGEVGIIVGIDEAKRKVLVKMEDREVSLPFDNYPFMTHAWNSTIHKSQGSEYDCVIITMPSDHEFMLSRRLLYTGVTRGKKQVFIVGSKETLERTVKKQNRTFEFNDPRAKHIERLTHLPFLISEGICLKSNNKLFQLLGNNSINKKTAKPSEKLRVEDILVPF